MRLSKLALIFFIGLLLTAAMAVGALFLVDPNVFRGQLEARASAAFGRPFRINGAIGLQRSLRPRIVIQGITIDNPDWATAKHFARAEEVAVQVALMPLLFGEMQVLDVRFAGVELFTEIRPDGTNNFTFGHGGDREAPQRLPSIEQLLIRDAVIHHRLARGKIDRYEITQAQLWNIPGEPERIAAEGSARGMQYRIQFTADSAAELSGPQNPWSVHLEMQGPDMTLNFDGQMAQAFTWDQLEGRLIARGQQAERLETLLATETPLTGPFEIAAVLRSSAGLYRLTDLVARGQGPSGRPLIKITDGVASGGPNAPLSIAVQGKLDDTPLTFRLESEHLPALAATEASWPLTATLQLADTALDLRGTMTTEASGAKHLAFDGRLKGDSLDTLARIVDRDLPAAGPYQFSFHADIGEQGYELDRLAGEIKDIEGWDTITVKNGRAALDPDGSIKAAIEAGLNGVPLSLSVETGPQEATEASERIAWPLQVQAAVPGTEMTGKGAILVTGTSHRLELATQIRGERLDTLGNLTGTSLPHIGPYDLKADLESDGEVHRLRDLQAQLGANRLTGELQWRHQDPRPLLTGRLSANRLKLKALASPAAPTAGRAGARIDLGWLKAFDTRLDVAIENLADTPVPVKQIDGSVTIADGRLSAPFRARVSDTPCEGQVDLSQPGNTPRIALQASADRIDAGRILQQIGLSEEFGGTVAAARFDGHSSGRTWDALLDRAVLKVKLSPADLQFKGQLAGRPIDLVIAAAEVTADKEGPLRATFSGQFQGVPFDARASTARLRELTTKQTPLPIHLDMQTAYAGFSGSGTVARPFGQNVFDLEHEISGDEIEGLDPLNDLALPLQGAFSARGSIAGRGDRLTYEETLRVGQSDFKMTLDMWRNAPRPRVKAVITSETIYLNDVKIIPGNDPSTKAAERKYLLPEYMLPVDYLRVMDLDIDIRAQRILSDIGELGSLESSVTLKDGHFESTTTIAKPKGGRVRKFFAVDATVDPPVSKLEIDAYDIDYTFLRQLNPSAALEEGDLDLHLRLSGAGTTRRKFLAHADGVFTVIGGPGRLRERRIDLWAADLIPTLLSPQWQRDETTEVNCMVAHVGVADGLATINDVLLDARLVTIAATGVVNLKTEALDIIIVPRPKRASLVSLANPVNITGTLSQPEISVARLPGRSQRRLARTGLLAGLINPLFLLTAFSDTGTFGDDSCADVIERARQTLEEVPP